FISHPFPLHAALPISLHAAVPVAGPSAPQHADFRDRQDPHGRGRWVVTRRVASLAVALGVVACSPSERAANTTPRRALRPVTRRSEEHTSELQSRGHL